MFLRHPREHVNRGFADLAALLDMIGSDELLLFATDWPHWRFEGTAALPPGLPDRLRPRVLRENALATYPRLKESEP